MKALQASRPSRGSPPGGPGGQRGVALALVLILLGASALLLAPTLDYTSTALKSFRGSRNTMWAQYAVEAITRQALWMLQYDNAFQCDPPPALPIRFADCVATKGPWTLTTQLTGDPYVQQETLVERVNNQDVTVKVEVPPVLDAPPPPTPTPYPSGATRCLYVSVSRDKTWVQVNEPITYTITAWSCSSPSAPDFNLRRLVALLSPGFAFATNSSSGDFPAGMAPNNPQQSLCDGVPNDPGQTVQRPDYFPCPDTSPPIVNNSKHLEWPSATQSLWSAGNTIDISPGQTRTFRFTARPTTWGVYYIDTAICYFSNATGDPGPCSTGNVYKTGKVAPVQVGIYNITGRGKGYVYMGSARLDSGGSELISQQTQ